MRSGRPVKCSTPPHLRLGWLAVLTLSSSVTVFAQSTSTEHTATASATAFLQNHCGDCHSADDPAGGLDITTLSTNLSDEGSQAVWIRIHDRVAGREMPPANYDQPAPAARASFLRGLHKQLTAAHAAEKGTILRRLNRREYENTLNDLFGTNVPLVSTLPADGRSHEFDNVGAALSISVVQMQRYLDNIEAVLDAAIARATTAPEVKMVRASYADTRGGEKFLGNQWLLRDDGAVVFFRRLGYPTGMLREASVRQDGYYRIRVTGYAHQSERPITFSIGSTTFARGAEKPTFAFRSMPPGKPTTVEITAWMSERHMVQVEPWGIHDGDQIKKVGLENYEGPGLAILQIEVEGPLTEQFPTAGHQLLFTGLDRREIEPARAADKLKPWYQPRFEIATTVDRDRLTPVLTRVMSAAFRRPVEREETGPFADLFFAEREAGARTEQALRTTVAAIFCSPEFLFLQENPGLLNDDAIASRLSYFLTRTTPDPALRRAADEGRLQQDAQLKQQTERLLRSRHASRFVADFCDAWLNLREMEFTTPDSVLFPEFDLYLKHSSVQETRAFVRELIDGNLPVRNLVASDFAMLNERLAEHYNLPQVTSPQVRKVRLPADSVRGGLLSQASVMKVSANGTNTSPVVRGVFVLERFLGTSPPPPPPGIPGVEPDIRGGTTLREILARHRDVDSCRSCHQMIDPPGFALECFDPIGGYRSRFRSLGEGDKVDVRAHGRKVRYRLGPSVDASGVTEDGQAFEDYLQYRDLLASDEDCLARSFATKLLTFATGREMGFSDRAGIDEIVNASRRNGHRVRDLIHTVIQSPIFRTR
ncbi:MAG: DUF1592 domain-containing protein [Planctomycetaceae bacterium]|nr:DUF1592 domain-containing protein [Planctomycetaceae bacterium]